MKFLNLKGLTFGNWFVIEYAGKDVSNKSLWECVCTCGTKNKIISSNLTSGKSTKCILCAERERFKDYSGETFSEITLISFDRREDNKTYWICKCSCGKTESMEIGSIINGHRKTCGHNFKVSSIKIGDVFSKLKVIEDVGIINKKHCFLCICECGNTTISQNSHLLSGGKTSCGCILSRGEREIEIVLKKLDTYSERQKIFPRCKYVRYLRFDFYIPVYNLCIEYQGKQHYIENCFSYKNSEDLKEIQKRDIVKRNFCKKEKINFLEIPYWEFNNIESIITEKLYDINSKL